MLSSPFFFVKKSSTSRAEFHDQTQIPRHDRNPLVVVNKKNVSGLSLFLLCFHFFSHSFQTNELEKLTSHSGKSISKMAKCKRLEAQIFGEQIHQSWFKLAIQHEHQNTNKNENLPQNIFWKHHLDSKSQTWIAGDTHFGRIPDIPISKEFSGKFG